MRTVVAVLAFGAVAVTPWAGQAQPLREASRVSIEVLVDGAFPTSKLGLAELDAGLGMGANVRVRLQPHLLAYAGWEWHKFATEELVASQAVDVEETGYTFGVRFEQPFRGESATTSAPGYWLRAGGMWNHLEIEDDEGEIIADTGHGLGWEAGAGVTFPLGSRLAFAPGVRYRTLSRDLTIASSTRSVTLSYVAATVGLTIAF
jgi:hypothetical protein